MRWLARFLVRLTILIAALLAITVATLNDGDPSIYPGQGPRIHVIDHGYHSGIVIRSSTIVQQLTGTWSVRENIEK